MNVVQFTSMQSFISDLAAGEPAAVYHELIEQQVARNETIGLTRWQLTTVLRAIVANGRVTHAAMLTFAHGQPTDRVYGRLFGPGDEDKTEAVRWEAAREANEAIRWELKLQLADAGLSETPMLRGILHVPGDLPLVYAGVEEVMGQQ